MPSNSVQNSPEDLPIGYTSNPEAREPIHMGLSKVSGGCVLCVYCAYTYKILGRDSAIWLCVEQ